MGIESPHNLIISLHIGIDRLHNCAARLELAGIIARTSLFSKQLATTMLQGCAASFNKRNSSLRSLLPWDPYCEKAKTSSMLRSAPRSRTGNRSAKPHLAEASCPNMCFWLKRSTSLDRIRSKSGIVLGVETRGCKFVERGLALLLILFMCTRAS